MGETSRRVLDLLLHFLLHFGDGESRVDVLLTQNLDFILFSKGAGFLLDILDFLGRDCFDPLSLSLILQPPTVGGSPKRTARILKKRYVKNASKKLEK